MIYFERKYFFSFLVIIISLSCSKSGQELSISRLQSTPTTIQINNQKISLRAYLWRDFMPISPPDGRPLKVRIFLESQQNVPLQEAISLKNVWVIKGEEIWTKVLSNLSGRNSGRVEALVEGGPKWPPGDSVTVVVQLEDEKGDLHLIRSVKQPIERTN